MVWAFVIILVLLIPLLAIVIDSPAGQALAERIAGSSREDADTEARLEALEAEVRYLSESVESLREEAHFLRSLLEGRSREPERLEGETERPPEPGE